MVSGVIKIYLIEFQENLLKNSKGLNLEDLKVKLSKSKIRKICSIEN